jgi:methyl-accepting chemotaxis protein
MTASEPTGQVRVDAAALARVAQVLAAAARGDLEPRLLHLDDLGALAPIAGLVNELLDTTDGFLREARASLGPVAQGQFHRQVVARGFPGAFRAAAHELNAATAQMAQNAARLAQGRRSQLELGERFEHTVITVSRQVSDAARSLAEASERLGQSADVSRQATARGEGQVRSADAATRTLSDRTADITHEVQQVHGAVAAASGELDRVREQVGRTEATAIEMVTAAQGITGVVEAMRRVAAQTRLLAINASVEAARAGPAGKGFSVVASEVKKLAVDTADASEDIARRTRLIQGSSERVVEDTRAIETTMQVALGRVREIAESAGAEARAATGIGESLAAVVEGSRALREVMAQVSDGTSHAHVSAQRLLAASGSLQSLGAALDREVTSFLAALQRGG